MIVGDLKPIVEIAASLGAYRKILLLGCGGCVTVCRSGGLAETQDLAHRLSHPEHHRQRPPELVVDSIERQCECDMLTAFLKIPKDTEAVLSLACGAGVQSVAEVFEPLPVIPALSTTFMGAADEPGIWREKCRGCGDCMLALTAGICPISLCAKSLQNGPCGGSQDGHCEVDTNTPCAWVRIHDRLDKQGRLHLMDEYRPPRDWRKAGNRGPRQHRRIGIALK